MLLVLPKVVFAPNKLVAAVVVVAVVPVELELDPNKLDPPNGEEDGVPSNVELVADVVDGAPKPNAGGGVEGATEDGVEDEEDGNENPNEGVGDEAGAPNAGLGFVVVDEVNREGDELGFEENEKGEDDEDDDGNENGDGDDDEVVGGFVDEVNIEGDELGFEENEKGEDDEDDEDDDANKNGDGDDDDDEDEKPAIVDEDEV